MIEYVLNCSIYYYSKDDGCSVLYSSETFSNDKESLEHLIGEFSGEVYYGGEFTPKKPCIKYSVIIGYNDEKENLHILVEKYKLLNLHDFYKDFWNIADKLHLYQE